MAMAPLLAQGAQDTPPPVEERPPITSTSSGTPEQPPPAKPKPKPPAPPAAKKPSCLLPDAEYQALMAVKTRALAACENTYTPLAYLKCVEAEKEWDAEFSRMCGPGSLGERRANGQADPPPAPTPASSPTSSASSPEPGSAPPAGDTSATPPLDPEAAPKEESSVGNQCPPADAPLTKGKSTPRDTYLDRVAMQMLLPGLYKQNGSITPALPPAQVTWVIAQAMEETMRSSKPNILNIQFHNQAEAAKHGTSCTMVPRYEYLSPIDQDIRVEGWAPSSKGKYLERRWVCEPTYPDTVAAVTDYLVVLKDKWPQALAALTTPSATLQEFARGLQGYGGAEPYRNPPVLEKKLRERLKELDDYLGRRLEALRLAAPCKGGLEAEIAVIEAAQAAAKTDSAK
jgi:hypothetical protein